MLNQASSAEVIPDGSATLLLDRSGKVMASSPSAQRLLGLSSEQLALCFCQTEAESDAQFETESGQDQIREQMRFTAAGGETLVVKASRFILDDILGAGAHTLVILEPPASHSSLAFGLTADVAASFGRQVQTPLSSISGYLEMLLQQDSPVRRGELKRMLTTLHRHTALAQHMVGNLVALLNIQARTYRLDMQPIPLPPLVEEAVDVAAALVEEGHQSITMVLPGQTATIMADRPTLVHALSNVLFTAVRNTRGDARVVLGVTATQGFWRIAVSAGRPGTSWWQREALRPAAADGPASATDGTDLGIAIAKSVVELHGGTIELASSAEKGNVCWLMLPAAT